MKIQFQEDKTNDLVFATTVINGTKYRIIFDDYYTHWYVMLSSGKKRRELQIYEQKESKSANSWEVVRWILYCIDQFPYKGRIVINWADQRRKRIYGRYLMPLGFKLTTFENRLCYMKNYD